MKKLVLRGLSVVAIIFVLVVVTLGLFLDSAIKKSVETFGPKITKVSVQLDSVKVSILSGSGGVKGLVIGNPPEFKTPNAISVGSASLGLSPVSLLSDKIVIRHIRVEAPEITFEGGIRENNLSKILDNLSATAGGASEQPGGSKEAGPGKKLQVDDFLIKGAKVNLSLAGMGGKTYPVTLPDIHLTNLGTDPEGISAAALSKRVLDEIITEASKAATSDAVNNLSNQATDKLNDVVNSKSPGLLNAATNLFKKKK